MDLQQEARTRSFAQPFRTVLVTTDLSERSTPALDRALTLPLAIGARIDVVHALSAVPAKVRAEREAEALQGLERELDRCRSRTVDIELTSQLVHDEPHVAILRRARTIGAELVVVGRHGQQRTLDRFIGTTAARVVRMGETPVLVAQREVTGPYQRPLVATDLEDTLPELLQLTVRVLSHRGVVDVVHALRIPFEGFVAPSAKGRERARKPLEREAMQKLARALAPYSDHARWLPIVATGDPRTVLATEAVRRRADVIVLGTHARSGLAHALVGSVAEWTLQNADCDVLVSRPMRFSFELP